MRKILILALVCLSLFISADQISAQPNINYVAPANLFPRDGLEDRINFWKSIFTKYGARQDVFHYRNYPWITYSVVDYEKESMVADDFALRKIRKERAAEEIKKIRTALTNLSEGKSPKNQLEQKIERQFVRFQNPSKQYRLALEDGQVRYQTGIKERFMDGIRRSGRYLHIIEDELARAGVPVELSRLPLVESSFNYEAYSFVGAAGIWQFMPSTGRLYNMAVNKNIDERRDPVESTKAAAAYLRNSHDKLGAWPVAITSYNHGLGGMLRATANHDTKDMATIIEKHDGKTFGFASKNFYAEFIAALEVEKNYKFYFPELEKETPWYVDSIKISSAENYDTLVKATGLSKEEFCWYNRALMSPIQKGQAKVPAGYIVKVPVGLGNSVVASIKSGRIVDKHASSTVFAKSKNESTRVTVAKTKSDNKTTLAKAKTTSYKVKKGDTIGSIAKRFSVSKKDLMADNNIKDPTKLRAGQTIKVARI